MSDDKPLSVADQFVACERRIEELEDHYRGAREIIQGERLRREEAERVSLSAQQRIVELAAQVARLRGVLIALSGAVDVSVSGVREVGIGEWLELLNQSRDALGETKPDGA